jgi:hypothetical protein
MSRYLMSSIVGMSALVAASAATAQDTRQAPPAAPVQPLANEPQAKLTVYAPLADPLSFGRVVIQYRAEHVHIVPVFGPAALAVSPRIGHIHITVDDAPWHWADASGEPLIINDLPAGPHKVLIQLVNANHHPIDQGVVQFTVPAGSTQTANH